MDYKIGMFQMEKILKISLVVVLIYKNVDELKNWNVSKGTNFTGIFPGAHC